MALGRPPFKPTKAQRHRCSVLAAARMSEADIARVFGVSVGTLRKHFDEELTVGVALRNAEMNEALFESGKAGNVAAMKAWQARASAIPGATDAPSTDGLGKKEIQEIEAKRPPAGEWGELVKH